MNGWQLTLLAVSFCAVFRSVRGSGMAGREERSDRPTAAMA